MPIQKIGVERVCANSEATCVPRFGLEVAYQAGSRPRGYGIKRGDCRVRYRWGFPVSPKNLESNVFLFLKFLNCLDSSFRGVCTKKTQGETEFSATWKYGGFPLFKVYMDWTVTGPDRTGKGM